MSKIISDLRQDLNLKQNDLNQFELKLKTLLNDISNLQTQHQDNKKLLENRLKELGPVQKILIEKNKKLPNNLEELQFKISSAEKQLIDLEKQQVKTQLQIENLKKSMDSDTKALQRAESEIVIEPGLSAVDDKILKEDKLYQNLLTQLQAKQSRFAEKEIQLKFAHARGADDTDSDDEDNESSARYEKLQAQQRTLSKDINDLQFQIIQRKKDILAVNGDKVTKRPSTPRNLGASTAFMSAAKIIQQHFSENDVSATIDSNVKDKPASEPNPRSIPEVVVGNRKNAWEVDFITDIIDKIRNTVYPINGEFAKKYLAKEYDQFLKNIDEIEVTKETPEVFEKFMKLFKDFQNQYESILEQHKYNEANIKKQDAEKQTPSIQGPLELMGNTALKAKEGQLQDEQKLKEEKRIEEEKILKETEQLKEAKRLEETARKLKDEKRIEDERRQKEEEHKRKLEEDAKKQEALVAQAAILKAQADAAAKAQADAAAAKAQADAAAKAQADAAAKAQADAAAKALAAQQAAAAKAAQQAAALAGQLAAQQAAAAKAQVAAQQAAAARAAQAAAAAKGKDPHKTGRW